MADDATPLMHVDWLRTLEAWRQELQTPIEINVEQIIGGGQPLTRINDTNVTLTLTGTPLTALLKPVTATLGWSGTLAPVRGGLGFDASGVDKGGIIVGTAPDTFALKVVGSNAQVLTADSTVAGGVKWATPTSPFVSTPMPILDSPDDGESTWAMAAAGSPARVVTVTGPTGPAGPAGFDGADSGDDPWASAMAHSAAWGALPISDDTTTNATMYPTWVSAASGALPLKVSSTKLTFNPSTGNLDVAGTYIQVTKTVLPSIRINLDTGTGSQGTLAFYEGATEKAVVQYTGSAFATANRRGDLVLSATRVVYGTNRTLMDGDATLSYSRSLTVGQAANSITGIEIIAHSTSWFMDNRGTNDATNDRWMLGNNSLSNVISALQTGQVGLGTGSPTAWLHLKAGTTAASTAPLKFTSGTNQTTAEAGAMEYNGTNLFFTRAGTVRENVLVAIDNATAPTTSIGVAIVNFYGANATNYLGDPNRWLSVNVLGTTYKIPLYT